MSSRDPRDSERQARVDQQLKIAKDSEALDTWIAEAIQNPFHPNAMGSLQSIIRYNDLADRYSRSILFAIHFLRAQRNLYFPYEREPPIPIPFGPNAVFLDLGGATGRIAYVLARNDLAHKVISVDVNRMRLEDVVLGELLNEGVNGVGSSKAS